MANRFNGGRGAITCDQCNTMMTSGSRQIAPYITVPNVVEDGDRAAHFCSRAHLEGKIVNVSAAMDHGSDDDDDAHYCDRTGLDRLIAARDHLDAAGPGILLALGDSGLADDDTANVTVTYKADDA